MSQDNSGPETEAPEAKESGSGISRRRALLTLGLAGLAAYAAPSLLGLTEAEARTSRRRRWTRTSRHYRHRRRRRYTRTSRHYRHRRWYPYSYRHYHRRPGFHLYIR